MSRWEIGAHNIDVFCWVGSFDKKGEIPRDPYPAPTVPERTDGSPFFATTTSPSSPSIGSRVPFVFASSLPFLVASHLPFLVGSHLPFLVASHLPFLLGSHLPFLVGSHPDCNCSSVAPPSLLPLAAVDLKPTCKEMINQSKYSLPSKTRLRSYCIYLREILDRKWFPPTPYHTFEHINWMY